MSVTADMARMWRRPGAVVRDLLAAGPREDRALAFLMGASFLTFLARLPILQRKAVIADADFFRDATYAFVISMLVAPLAFYGIAAVGRLIAHVTGLRVSGYGARLSLFWAYLAVSPLLLFHGLLEGFSGSTVTVQIVSGIGFLVLLLFWIIGLRVSGQEASHA